MGTPASAGLTGPTSVTGSPGTDGAGPRTPTRVLMILDSFSFGGAENLIAELGQYDPAQLTLSVASLSPADSTRDAMYGRLSEAGLHPTYLSVRRLTDLRGFLSLVKTLRAAPVDVVHAHLGYSATVVPLAARLVHKPVVATLHLCPQPHSAWRDRIKDRLSVRIPARLGRLVFVSQYAFDAYARLHGPPRSTWRTIRNGVDLTRFAARHERRRNDKPVWAAIAALRPDKNHLGLIQAWSEVTAVHPDATLLIVGDGPARDDIDRAVRTAGLEASVRLLGRREDVPDILGAVDGVVSASVDEALPTALIEAGACGLPVVAADAGGTREIVKDGVNGRLVPVRDVPALTRALLDMIERPDRAAAYGTAGRALVEKNYSLSVWIDRLDDLYAEVRNAL